PAPAAAARPLIGGAPDRPREYVSFASCAPPQEEEVDADAEPEIPQPPVASRQPKQSVVPDLTGLPARAAVRKLAEAALEPDLRGNGRTVAQSPRPGAIVKRGARVRVTLAPSG